MWPDYQDTPRLILSYFGDLVWLGTSDFHTLAYCLSPDGLVPVTYTTETRDDGRYQRFNSNLLIHH